MKHFTELNMNEMMEVDGGILGVDDAIFWGLVGVGFAAGVAAGINRKNR